MGRDDYQNLVYTYLFRNEDYEVVPFRTFNAVAFNSVDDNGKYKNSLDILPGKDIANLLDVSFSTDVFTFHLKFLFFSL